ncbi:hypothetical protein [Vibrio ishigakensis]|uniref:hypothetical protein n=1 Tax=Vibrio ishigakensis TaxID=1481914 RepID=UPI0021C3E76A|nr:hypothetical protein [Vibrio ishigakensis]
MYKSVLTSALVLALVGCGGSGGSSGPGETNDPPPVEECSSSTVSTLPSVENTHNVSSGHYEDISSTSLISQGLCGQDTYDLIESVFGKGSIEAPDLYSNNDPNGGSHIIQGYDDLVGNYFKFIIHFDDGDRDKGRDDRQRNEIKVYDKSDDKLKGFLGKTFEYSWKFKVGDDLKVTKHFTHLFQLKPVKGKDAADNINVSSPLLTITANVRSNKSGLEVRHTHYADKTTGKTENNTLAHTAYMDDVSWSNDIQGQWLEAFVRVDYSETGSLYMSITPLGASKPMIEINESNLELWRSGLDGGEDNFVRPKWGIYRSLNAEDELNQDQDEVYFADFKIREVKQIQ